MVRIRSLLIVASVPVPAYFEEGWKNVANASKPFDSITVVEPEGIDIFITLVLSLP